MKTRFKNHHNVPAILNDGKSTLFGRPVGDVLAWDFFTSPNTNVREEKDYYHLEVAVPGLNRKDLTVEVNDNILNVFGEKKNANHNDVIHEFSYATFHRSFTLPEDANAHAISAKCRDGMLTIRIDKTKGTGRLIPVSGSGDESSATGSGVWRRFVVWWDNIWK